MCRDAIAYTAAQILGGIVGALLANATFDLPVAQISSKDRASVGHGLGEVVATAGLILLIFALAQDGPGRVVRRRGRRLHRRRVLVHQLPTAFANPAVTIGRMFSDTFAGIAPGSVPLFVGAQLLGAAAGLALVRFLFPDAADATDRVVVPHAITRTAKED